MHRRIGRTRWAVAGTAAASLALLVGIKTQITPHPTADSHPAPPVAVAPSRTAVGQPAPTTAPATKIVLVGGEVRTQTVTVTPPPPASRAGSLPASRAPNGAATPTKGGVPPATATATGAGGPTGTTPPPTTDPPVDSGTPTPSLTAAGTGVGNTSARLRLTAQS